MDDITSCRNCTGCGACRNICPTGAISMDTDTEGFAYPKIDRSKCINCGLCERTCPSLHPECDNREVPECFAASATDELRQSSTSGGVFPLLAAHVLKQGGVVCGAAYDESCTVKHIIVNNLADLEQLKGSKYVQSDIGETFSTILKLLKEKTPVLFSGTPCQVAGLKKFLGKDDPLLHTVDVICHGVPSNKVFQRYLAESYPGKKVKHINFRDKINGWNSKLVTSATTETETIYTPAHEDSYITAFLKNLSLRPSCGQCPFAHLQRQGDLSLGDYWGIENCNPALNDGKGLSLVLSNNAKGDTFLKAIRKELKVFSKLPVESALPGNHTLSQPFAPHSNRRRFFANMDCKPLADNVADCLNDKYDCVMLNFWSTINYGAVLTVYALQQTLHKLGYHNVATANFHFPWNTERYPNSFTKEFADKYLDLTDKISNGADFDRLNERSDTFIVGSDQVFRLNYIQHLMREYLLGFTHLNKKRIAYAASFGVDQFNGTSQEQEIYQKLLGRFAALSVREYSGQNLCRNIFGIEAEQILDPVFLMDVSDYEVIIKDAVHDYTDKLVTYVLDMTPEVMQACTELANRNQTELVNLADFNVSVADYLSAIKNSRLFITDSFHGACFAILFNKPFICLNNAVRGQSRFETLSKIFDIKLGTDAENLNLLQHNPQAVDWQKVNSLIDQHKGRSIAWLQEAMSRPYQPTAEQLVTDLAYCQNLPTLYGQDLSYSIPKYNLLEHLFSLKNLKRNGKKYKVISFLGLKFRFRKGK